MPEPRYAQAQQLAHALLDLPVAARAVCLAALHALRAAGATQAVVLSHADAAGAGAQRLYTSLGFTPVTRIINYRWEPPATSAP